MYIIGMVFSLPMDDTAKLVCKEFCIFGVETIKHLHKSSILSEI